MKIGRREKDVKAGPSGRLEAAKRSVNIVLAGAGERRNTAGFDFSGDGTNGIEISRRGNGETSFEHVDAENFQLPRQLQLFRAMHGEARRLFAVAERGVENMDLVQADSSG